MPFVVPDVLSRVRRRPMVEHKATGFAVLEIGCLRWDRKGTNRCRRAVLTRADLVSASPGRWLGRS